MFLNVLELPEKKAFLKLAHLVARVDGIINEDEEKIIATYLKEMQVPEFEFENLPLDSIISFFEKESSKNIVFIEILGLIFADGTYSEEERVVLKQIKQAFGFTPEKYAQYKSWVQKINETYQEGLHLIYG